MSRTQGLGDLPRPAPAAHGERGTRLLPGPPAKALLERLALQLSCAPLELYKSFLSDCTSANHAPNAVSILEEELASRFYGPPDEEPRYCSMDKANDLSFLRLVSGVTFVVYQRHKSFGLLRVFDNRVQLAACLGGSEPSPALVFLLDDVGDGRRLYEVPGEGFFDPAELRDLSLRIAPRFSRPQPVGDCLLSALASVLGVEPGSRRGGRLWSLADVLLDPVGVWEALRTPFALAEHVGVQPWKWKQRNANQPFRQRFKVLLTVYDRPGGGLVPWPEVRVVCLSYHGYLTLVDGPNTERLLQERTRDVAARPGERLAAFPSLARPGSQEHLDEQEYLQLTGPDKPAPVDHRRLTPCECQLCRECNKYQDNLERCGSQKLYTVDWDLFTYLRALGLDSEEHQAAVREALSLSVSGMDLETSTVSLAAGEASPEGGLAAPHEKITFQSRQGGSCELAERILLIGHIDNLGRESGSYDVEIFESGRRPAGVKNVVHSYVRYVCVRQRKMELRKRLLLRPLLEFASEHRRAHLRCLEEAGVELRSALGSWDFSLLGRFEKRLEKLCRKYYVYAFNGSGFDFPLLCGHLSTAPWMRRQWSIQRNGSSVTMMSMGGRCIYFRGASELLLFFLSPLVSVFSWFFPPSCRSEKDAGAGGVSGLPGLHRGLEAVKDDLSLRHSARLRGGAGRARLARGGSPLVRRALPDLGFARAGGRSPPLLQAARVLEHQGLPERLSGGGPGAAAQEHPSAAGQLLRADRRGPGRLRQVHRLQLQHVLLADVSGGLQEAGGLLQQQSGHLQRHQELAERRTDDGDPHERQRRRVRVPEPASPGRRRRGREGQGHPLPGRLRPLQRRR